MNKRIINILFAILYIFLFTHIGILFLLISKYATFIYTQDYILMSVIIIDIFIISYILTALYKLNNSADLKSLFFEGEIFKREVYLKYAAQIIRHDMNSGINIYIPRGLKILEEAVESCDKFRIQNALTLMKRGLSHTQTVFSGVKEFTEIFRDDSTTITLEECNLREILLQFLNETQYSEFIDISDLGNANVSRSLFCIALDNLIRNGLNYNDSENKLILIYRRDNVLFIEDNGRGLSQEDFELYSKPFMRKSGQDESGDGLGLAITKMILNEHKFKLDVVQKENGTIMKITMENIND